MYQEVEIPKKGKHSMSQDLPVLFFSILVFLFVLFCLFVFFKFPGASYFLHFQRLDRIHIFRIHVEPKNYVHKTNELKENFFHEVSMTNRILQEKTAC